MKIVTAAEMREIDRLTTEKHGIPSLTLMENAGTAVAEFALKHFEFTSVCAVCGKGNNGGDGYVAVRKLHQAGKKVSVIILAKSADELRGDAAEMFKKLPVSPIWASEDEQFSKADLQQALQADLILDAILGTGFKAPVKGTAVKAIELINQAHGRVVAVDLPSGMDADSTEPYEENSTFVRADSVISFTAAKSVLVFSNPADGPIAIASIGSPQKVISAVSSLREEVLTAADMRDAVVPRKRDAHKGDFGHVLVVGGSVGKSGAAAMAGMAALRTGAGLVTVACPKSVQPEVAAHAAELMTDPLDETPEGTISVLALANRESWLAGKMVTVIGPGISRNQQTAEFVRDLVGIYSGFTVIDADGLNAFAGRMEDLQPDQETSPRVIRVLTPHPGEMSRLTGIPTSTIQKNRVTTALKAAIETHCCIVLKGHRTIIASPDGYVWVNTTGNPGMAKGGSGDVLSGMIAAMLGQYLRPSGGIAWLPEWDENSEFDNPESEVLVHRVSTLDPEAKWIKQKHREYEKTHDPKLREELQASAKKKVNQVLTWLNCLNVSRAVYLHGLAGDIARDLNGERSMIAGDIINCIGEALAVCEEESHSKFAYIQR
jgi:ADP-dependent NAD(P)H-hydrate dehydratase / NAD(P)H-hydrate epimerase